MPSRPISPLALTRWLMSAKVRNVNTCGLLANTRTRPPCSTTNQRVLSPGACSSATGNAKLNAGNTRSTASATAGGAGGVSLSSSPPPHPLTRIAAPASAAR